MWEGDDWQRTKEKSNSAHCKKRSWMASRPSCVLDGAYSLSFSITENTLHGCCCTTLCIAVNAARIQTHHGVGAWRHWSRHASGVGTRAWMHAASMQGSAGAEALRVPCTLRTTCVGARVFSVAARLRVWTMVRLNAAHANSARNLAAGEAFRGQRVHIKGSLQSSHSLLDLSYSTHVG